MKMVSFFLQIAYSRKWREERFGSVAVISSFFRINRSNVILSRYAEVGIQIFCFLYLRNGAVLEDWNNYEDGLLEEFVLS